ncbi:MAG: hypothetical protein JNL89_19070 [Rhodanobacteraceae bacterium]|nr:hypothetical protein [Rhodanobacteraceae bacterium]
MLKRLAAAIALALPLSAYALSNSFSYQGSLNDGGSPASGSYDLQFQLQTSAGVNVGAPLVREDVAVSGGLFSVELDFGAAITSGDFRLQIGVRPGASTGAYTTLSPTTNIRPTPQAQVAGIASEAVTVSPDSITSASIQSGAVTTSEIADSTVLSTDIADGTIGGVDVDINEVQWRVANACTPGQAIRTIAATGAVTCENTVGGSGGTVTSIATGTGLTGGPITASGTISIANSGVTSALIADGTVANADLAANSVNAGNIVDGSVGSADINSAQVQARVTGTCAAGSSIRDISATGTVTCETDDGTGTVTSVASGAGLTGGPITSSGTLSIATSGVTSAMISDGTVANVDMAANSVNAGNIVDGSVGGADVNTAQVQARVTGTCAAGSSISTIAANGTVTCETDDVGPAAWSLTGNTGTNSSTQFIGTTDAQSLVLRTRNARSLSIEPSTTLVGGVPLTVNWVAGHSGNTATAGVTGATIGGGGAFAGGDPSTTLEDANRVTDAYGTVAGGAGNTAGDGDAALYDRIGATVSGGLANLALGSFATVGGGSGNTANEDKSTVAGGKDNLADGFYATVGGGEGNDATSSGATVAGGFANKASGTVSTVAGGTANHAQGYAASIGGGEQNCAGGRYSFANGFRAKVRLQTGGATTGGCIGVATSGDANGDEGTYVWADSQASDFVSTGPNQFLVRADGGVMINTNALPASGDDLVLRARTSGDTDVDIKLLTQNGTAGLIYLDEATGSFFLSPQGVQTGQPRLNVTGGTGGVATLSNGGTWTNASSRSYKTGFIDVDPMAILDRLVALPISTWTYRGSEEGTHLGPMAEDFKAAFDLAGDGKSIATVDADGVALAAIQGLNQKLESENAALRAELAELRALVLERMRD